jgi:hypothetical protein
VNISRFLVGNSGWSYGHWRGLSYLADLPQREGPTDPHSHPPTCLINHTVFRPPSAKVQIGCSEHILLSYVYELNAPAQSQSSRSCAPPGKSWRDHRGVPSPRDARRVRFPAHCLPRNWKRNASWLNDCLDHQPVEFEFEWESRHLCWQWGTALQLLRGDAGLRHVSVPGFSWLFVLMCRLLSPRLHRIFGKRGGTGTRVLGATQYRWCPPA